MKEVVVVVVVVLVTCAFISSKSAAALHTGLEVVIDVSLGAEESDVLLAKEAVSMPVSDIFSAV